MDIAEKYQILYHNSRKVKTSDCEAGICFYCNINEQTSNAIGQKARQRGFVSLHIQEGKVLL